nr:Gfo/Idh/MocA family oxidoreductase [Paenibacillus sp. SGZ-1014]
MDGDKRSLAVAATGASAYEAAEYIWMLDEMKPDLVYIAVPPAFHYDTAVAAFARGIAVFQLTGQSGRVEQERVSLLIHGEQGDIALKNWKQLYWNEVGQAPQRVEPSILPQKSHLPIFGEIVNVLQCQPGQMYDFYDGYNAQVVLEALRKPSAAGHVDVRPLYIKSNNGV